MTLATYKESGAIKLLYVPAPILRVPQTTDASTQPSSMPLALKKKPTFITTKQGIETPQKATGGIQLCFKKGEKAHQKNVTGHAEKTSDGEATI